MGMVSLSRRTPWLGVMVQVRLSHVKLTVMALRLDRPLGLDSRYRYCDILEPRVDSLVDRVRTYRGRRMSPQGLTACGPLVFCRVLALSLEPRLYRCRVVWHLLRYSLVIVYLLATRTQLFCCSSHNQSVPLYHKHTHTPLTMATQRLSNVLSHITPGSKSPLEQMYAPSNPHFLLSTFTWQTSD
jgi:hypothetical protein